MAEERPQEQGTARRPPLEPEVVSMERVMRLLAEGKMRLQDQIPWSSNFTYLAGMDDGGLQGMAIYKPQAGETPLWDFPAGTLGLREYAAFLVSESLGWRLVPPTILREGPKGPGMVQLYIDANPEEHYFLLRGGYREEFQRVALFDAVVNNADRKAGHVLRDPQQHIWVIDHGLTFHQEDKLRTVIWDFAGERVPAVMLEDLAALETQLEGDGPLIRALHAGLLSEPEIDALCRRLGGLLHQRTFPQPGAGRRIPWPPI